LLNTFKLYSVILVNFIFLFLSGSRSLIFIISLWVRRSQGH
jgi:hypothetical protein